MRRIVETRAGALIVVTAAAIAAGTAIPLYATGVFDSPPPACYVSAPAAGATLTGSAMLTASCGTSTVGVEFQLDGSRVATSAAAPFSVSWDSGAAANGSHTLTAIACDANSVCVTSGGVTVSTSNSSAPVNTVPPLVTGGTQTGQTLSTTTGTWGGDTSSGFSYQWKDGAGNIASATSSTYVIASGEAGANIHVTVTAVGTGGSTTADSNTVGPVTTPDLPTTARLWIATAGTTTCTRDNSALDTYAVALAANHVCTTGPIAYQKALLGDTILIENTGTFTTQWFFTKAMAKTGTPGTCDYGYAGVTPAADQSGCVTIEPANGQTTPTFTVPNSCTSAGTCAAQALYICADYLAIKNITINDSTFTEASTGATVSVFAFKVGSNDSTCGTPTTGTGYVPHDILLQNIDAGGGGTVNTAEPYVWVVGGTYRDNHNNAPNYVEACGAGSVYGGFVGTTFLGYTYSYSNGHHGLGAVLAWSSCGSLAAPPETDVFNHFVFAGNRVEGQGQPGTESLEMKSADGYDNNLIENNYFASTDVLDMECAPSTGSTCYERNNTVRFNTFSASTGFSPRFVGAGTATVDANVAYGNVNASCGNIGLPSGSVTGSLWTYSYNVEGAAQSGLCAGSTGSVYSTATSFVSAGSPNYNLDLAAAQTAAGFVTVGSGLTLPATNIYGTARTFPANAGGD